MFMVHRPVYFVQRVLGSFRAPLHRENVKIVSTHDVSSMTPGAVADLYAEKVLHELVPDFYGLRRFFDNIPGVPRVATKSRCADWSMARLTELCSR